MKNCSFRPSSAAVTLLASAAIFAAATIGQATQTPLAPQTPATPEAGLIQHIRKYPAPTNLQDLSGQQVHGIMEEWTTALGAHCATCPCPIPKRRRAPTAKSTTRASL